MERVRTLETKVIEVLRFPLIVGVVLIHALLMFISSNENYHIFNEVTFILSDCFARVAVPLFMIFSGYLFFFNISSFTKDVYLKKIKNRFHSLFVPYIIWNTIAVIVTLVLHIMLPEMLSGRNKLMTDYTLTDWLYTYWNTNEINNSPGTPCPTNYPLWFIRDLMILVLFSPVIYWLTKKLKWVFVISIGLLHMFEVVPVMPGLCVEVIFYFSLGAMFSIHKIAFANILKDKALPLTIAYATMLLLRELQHHGIDLHFEYFPISISRLMVITGVLATLALLAYIMTKRDITSNETLSKSSFFIYLYHALPLGFVLKLCLKIEALNSDIGHLIIYIASSVIIIIAGLLIYKIMKRYLPKITSVMMGGRL